ncbi:MAG: cation:proton antiporter subunit C [Defluviitaleaceae bacterium]|nr:cation:proton antiporter subunit C [Defluviitaleaceae bacterium]
MNSIELISIIVFFLGLYGLLTNRNIVKTIVFASMMEVGIIMFWLSIGFTEGMVAPIVASMFEVDNYQVYISDPLPQALMITAIVIGISITAIKTIMFITLYRKFKTTDWDIAKIKSKEVSKEAIQKG